MELSKREKCIFLIDNDQLKIADAIVILEGDGNNRIKTACELYKDNFAKKLVFSGGIENLPYGSFPFEKVKSDFIDNGVDPTEVIVDQISKHTQQQAEEIVNMCIKNDWHKLILVASHYHQLRAFLTFLKVLINKNLDQKIQLFNLPAKNLKWFQENPWGNRFDLLSQEFNRIDEYFLKGHLASFEEAITYQKWKEEQL